MQSRREKALFKPLFKATCTIEIRYPIRVPYFYYTNQKQVTGQIPSEKKTVRWTVFRERVTLHYSYAHAAASEAGSFEK